MKKIVVLRTLSIKVGLENQTLANLTLIDEQHSRHAQ